MVRWEHLATRWVERRRAPLSIVTDLKLRSSGLMPAAPSFASSWSFTGCFCAILLQFRWRRRGTAEGAAPGHNQRQARAWHGGSASGPPRRERWLGRARARVCVRPLGSPPACGFVRTCATRLSLHTELQWLDQLRASLSALSTWRDFSRRSHTSHSCTHTILAYNFLPEVQQKALQ